MISKCLIIVGRLYKINLLLVILSKADLPMFRRNVLAVSDQAATAASSFLSLLFLSKHFSIIDFGAYSLALSLFYIAASVHFSVIIEPMLVLGAGIYRGKLGSYLNIVVWVGNSAFSLLSGILLVLGSYTASQFGSTPTADALLGIGLAAPLSLLSVLMRRICYLRGFVGLAAISSTIYFVVLISCTILMERFGLLSLKAAAFPLGAASALSASIIFYTLPRSTADVGTLTCVEVTSEHASYARWSTLSELIHWLVSNLAIVALPVWASLEASATFKVLNLLYMPLYQIVFACMNSLLPILVNRSGQLEFEAAIVNAKRIWFVIAVLYALTVTAAAKRLLEMLYGGMYEVSSAWLVFLGIAGIFYTVANIDFAVLRSQQRPDAVFKSYVVLCLIMMLSLFAYPRLGITAVVLSLAVGWGGVCLITRGQVRVVLRCAIRNKRAQTDSL